MIPTSRSKPPERLPYKPLQIGPNGQVWFRVRYTMAEMRRWYTAWFDLFKEGKDNAEAAKVAVESKNAEAIQQIRIKDREIAERLEAIHAGIVMLAWADSSGDLETKARWDNLEFAGEPDPLEAAGVALAEELILEGYEPSDITAMGAFIFAEFFRALNHAASPAKEVEKTVEVFQETVETST